MMSEEKNILEVSHVSKRFGGKTVLKDLTFHVEKHSIYGFIGQNGAGKTTTMKLILGLFTADEGEIRVNGEPVRFGKNHTNRMIGYLPDVPEFYGYMTPAEYLEFCGELTGMSRKKRQERVGQMLELVGLAGENRRIQGFSRGMKQRLGIAQALLPEPELLICDEPTSALDPVGRREILEILKKAASYTTVLFSTHILPDVERICDKIGILHGGRLAWEGTMEDVHRMSRSAGFLLEFESSADRKRFADVWQKSGSGVCDDDSVHYLCDGNREAMKQAMELLLRENLSVQKMERQELTLENLFLEVLEERDIPKKEADDNAAAGRSTAERGAAGKVAAEKGAAGRNTSECHAEREVSRS
ncbi:MAG: ABC transporter ATP-binding protein [Lachnospiraceae bacterium]